MRENCGINKKRAGYLTAHDNIEDWLQQGKGFYSDAGFGETELAETRRCR